MLRLKGQRLRDGNEQQTGRESHGGDYNPPMRFSFLFAAVMGVSVSAQIATDLVDKRKTDFHTQATDADMKREGGTQPRDWDYNLPDGVTTRSPFSESGSRGTFTLTRYGESRSKPPLGNMAHELRLTVSFSCLNHNRSL